MKISLCLSGGGFRASSFAHGALLLLKEIGLEQQIHIISSVSGGTITATLYALFGKDFDDFCKRVNQLHEDDNLIERAATLLSEGQVNVPSKRKNIITSFAEVYNQDVFQGSLFGELWNENATTPTNLEDIIFNSTEFKTGTGFRFQKTLSIRARIGNGNVYISKEVAQEIRMSDILAASSCFSAGFEPLSLPNDFSLSPGTCEEIRKSIRSQVNDHEEKEADFVDEIALMDGGIYDNQGIEGVLLANDRRDDDQKSDLMIIVDVTSAGKDLYDPPRFKNRKWFWKIKMRWILFFFFLLTLAFALVPLVFLYYVHSVIDQFNDQINFMLSNQVIKQLSVLYLSIFSIFLLIDGYVLWRIRRSWRKLKKKMPVASRYGKKILMSRSLGQFIDMLSSRVSSTVSLASEIFLKRARAQVYEDAMEHDFFSDRAVTSILSFFRTYEQNKDAFDRQVPSELHLDLDNRAHKQIVDICNNASMMPTTLWFKADKKKKNKIVAAGGIILCYALIKYFHKMSNRNAEQQERLKDLLAIWDGFKSDPYGLLVKYNIAVQSVYH